MIRPRDTRAFAAVTFACALFFILTIVAMLMYPGGRVGDIHSSGYAFFTNFFSDLGQTQTHSGAANRPSLVLFCLALLATATGIIIFFVAFARLFAPGCAGRRISAVSAVCGILAAVSFIGVAGTPWNLYLRAHNEFVMWAFRTFLAAVVLDALAVVVTPAFPRRFALIFIAFGLFLAAYVSLLTFGPAPNTASGAFIQATGQKLIVYASVLTLLVASLGVQTVSRVMARR